MTHVYFRSRCMYYSSPVLASAGHTTKLYSLDSWMNWQIERIQDSKYSATAFTAIPRIISNRATSRMPLNGDFHGNLEAGPGYASHCHSSADSIYIPARRPGGSGGPGMNQLVVLRRPSKDAVEWKIQISLKLGGPTATVPMIQYMFPPPDSIENSKQKTWHESILRRSCRASFSRLEISLAKKFGQR